MKKRAILLLLLPFLLIWAGCFKPAHSDPGDQKLINKKEVSAETIDKLKKTRTVFFLPEAKPATLDSFKQAISSAWTLTPLIFDNIGNAGKYMSDPQYSYFVIEGNTTLVTGQASYENTFFYLTLRLATDVTKKGKINTMGLCRIELFPEFRTLSMGTYGNRKTDVIGNLYNKGVFYNWSPVMLKAQLSAVSTQLANHIRPFIYEEIRDDNLSSMLSKETLYISQTMLMSFNAFTGGEKGKEENVFELYPYKYRVCTDSELFRIFETEKSGRFLFEYVKSSNIKFVSVYDVKEKKIVYKAYKQLSYNLKAKDIRKMVD